MFPQKNPSWHPRMVPVDGDKSRSTAGPTIHKRPVAVGYEPAGYYQVDMVDKLVDNGLYKLVNNGHWLLLR